MHMRLGAPGRFPLRAIRDGSKITSAFVTQPSRLHRAGGTPAVQVVFEPYLRITGHRLLEQRSGKPVTF